MVDILKRSLAPITEEAWREIDNQAKIVIKGNLSGRSVVDFSGPHGWELGAVNTGRVKFAAEAVEGVQWGRREVLPLVETYVPFYFDLAEIDGISRGVKDPDLRPVHEAARKAAIFEEKALYYGFAEGSIEGAAQASPHKPLILTDKATYQGVITAAMITIKGAGIGGPFDLVLGSTPYQDIMAGDERGYPLKRRIEEIIAGTIRWSPAVGGGVLVSKRGGDYLFTAGQDFAIGYRGHDGDKVELYLTETFTFQVLEPAAAIELELKAS